MFYFVISMAAVAFMALQNIMTGRPYCIGLQKCSSNSITTMFVIKIVYVLFWTWLLNVICKNGNEIISWVLVFIPIIIMFIMIGITFTDVFDFNKWIPSISLMN